MSIIFKTGDSVRVKAQHRFLDPEMRHATANGRVGVVHHVHVMKPTPRTGKVRIIVVIDFPADELRGPRQLRIKQENLESAP